MYSTKYIHTVVQPLSRTSSSCKTQTLCPSNNFPSPLGTVTVLSVSMNLTSLDVSHWRRKWQPTAVFLPGESQGQGSLVGCRLWGRTCPWNSPGKKTGGGCNALLQGIFPAQGSKPGLPHCRQILYHLSHLGSPCCSHTQRQTQPEQSPELPPDLRAGAQSLRTQSHCLTPSAGNRNRIHLF